MAGDEYSYTGVIRTFQRLFVNGEDSAIQTIIKNSNKNVNASADTSANVNTDANEKEEFVPGEGEYITHK